MRISVVALTLVALLPARATAQNPDLSGALRWRTIGPFRAGRARALAGLPGQPTVFYIGFDNGGLWRSSDYGSNWEPLFDREATGSIGAIAVAPSSPNIIYVGTGAGIIRPDLATGNGMYRSNDTGRTWTQLGLAETQMIAYVDVDPTNPDRLFVAALGHPYGPNAERGIYRSTDGGRTFEKVLYKDEYTSGNEVRIVPSNPNTVYAALWQQQSTFYEYAAFGPDSTWPGAGGIYKSIDGGTTWTQLTNGLPPVLEANIAIAPSNPQVIYAMIASVNPAGGSGPVSFTSRATPARTGHCAPASLARRLSETPPPPPPINAPSAASVAATCRRSSSTPRTTTSSTVRRSSCGARKTVARAGRRCVARPAVMTISASGSTPPIRT